jgi:heme/copper-type cytochrome/quinol oxidase subunit 4
VSQNTNQNTTNTASHKQEGAGKHILAFIVMIALTAVSFYLVMNNVVPKNMILPFLLILAAVQVFLQLFIFMHLNQKGSSYYTVFMIAGILIAVISGAGIMLM